MFIFRSHPSARLWMLTPLFILFLASCTAAVWWDTSDTLNRDLRIVGSPSSDTVYIETRSPEVARSLCFAFGVDIRAEYNRAASDSRQFQLGRIGGCYVPPRHIIVCPEGDAACSQHEEKHKRGRDFH